MKKIGIIGSGVIAYMIALEINKFEKDYEIRIIGGHSKNGASQAAGAMLNILSEVDAFNVNSELMKWKLINRDIVLNYWKEIDELLSKNNTDNFPLIYGKGTRIKLSKKSDNKLESNSFKAMKDGGHQFSISIKEEEDNNYFYLDIPDEKSVDPHFLISLCRSYFGEKVNILNEDVIEINKLNKKWEVVTNNNKDFFDKIIIAAGSWSDEIIRSCNELYQPSVKSYNDVGSALLLSSEFPHIKEPKIDRIFRTPNRGGTCGIHSVQRKNTVYIGASSHPTHVKMKKPKASSLEALLSGIEPIVGLNSHMLSVEPVTGYRPVTEDVHPIIGEIGENAWCVYGTKRDGLTWSPYFAKGIANWVAEDEKGFPPGWEILLELSSPKREMKSYGEVDKCINSFVESKIAESYQHNIVLSEEKIKFYRDLAIRTHKKIEKRVGYPIGINPDLISILDFFN